MGYYHELEINLANMVATIIYQKFMAYMEHDSQGPLFRFTITKVIHKEMLI